MECIAVNKILHSTKAHNVKGTIKIQVKSTIFTSRVSRKQGGKGHTSLTPHKQTPTRPLSLQEIWAFSITASNKNSTRELNAQS